MSRFFDYSELPRILLEALIILCVGVLVGLSLHFQLVREVLDGRLLSPAADRDLISAQSAATYPEPVDLTSVREWLSAGAVLVDARIEELYRQGHLPGSVMLPLAEAAGRLEPFRRRHPAATPVIVYCSGYGCPDSFDLAMLLIGAGFEKVMVFEGGYPEWRDAGLPIVEGE